MLFERILRRGHEADRPRVYERQWDDAGIRLRLSGPPIEVSVEGLHEATDAASPRETCLTAYLSQLIIEDRCQLTSTGVLLPWGLVYDLRRESDHAVVRDLLELPQEHSLSPVLECRSTLADRDFEITIEGWAEAGRAVPVSRIIGGIAIVREEEWLLSEAAWRCSQVIERFSARATDQRTQHDNELAWGEIRPFADAAGALYRAPYLETTFVITPKTLRLKLSRETTAFGRVTTVEPTFDGAPEGWIRAFDRHSSVQPHYDLTPAGGFARVVVSEPVRQVLTAIKRDMPNRKVAGSRAEQFLHNPWSFLGEAAYEVLREEEFLEDKAAVGPLNTTFSLHPQMGQARIESVYLTIEEQFANGGFRTNRIPIHAVRELDEFISELASALRDDRRQVPWGEYDLSIDAESPLQLETARQLSHLWKAQPAQTISLADVYELASYSNRIEGIGIAKPSYIPLIQKPSDSDQSGSGWLPADLVPMVRVTLAGHEGQVVIPLTREWVEEFSKQVEQAETAGNAEIRSAALPTALATSEARTLLDGFHAMLNASGSVKPAQSGHEKPQRRARETLLVKTNFHKIDYLEERAKNLAVPTNAAAKLPACLRPTVNLKKHQLDGIAWFQHLLSHAPAHCRGALLADDMGLGKTLQLLAVLGRHYEIHSDAGPSLIVAPKSLIKNWESEVRKFFTPSFPELLVLYGEQLRERKQPLSLIDSELQSRGVTDLLRPDWAGNAKVIITTYEVLTNYEFSLARIPFAFTICDEAQRIKTPGTQVSMAVRALKSDFRIVCTGTPVENSLADLWCLFDFVQPGLIGGLEEFGKRYRRPIECETEDQKEALEELKRAIGPQILRRTKHELKAEFKNKYFVIRRINEDKQTFTEAPANDERLEIPMSAHQGVLYLAGLKKLHEAAEETDSRRRARASFAALHLMKAVCAEPYCIPGRRFLPDRDGTAVHFRNSAKLAWLIEQLRLVKAANEKAIVFTELREVQLCLFYFFKEVFGIRPAIINGDSENRQSYIDRFSASEGFDVIILSTLAAGAGLNVTAANHVFHFTRAWNPAKESQATDRAYRIGQEKDVFVYCPVAVSEDFVTFDVRLDQMLRRKAALATATLGDSSLTAMLNGTGSDVRFTDLVVDTDAKGSDLAVRALTLDDVDRLDGFGFEVLCQLLWSKQGYIARVTPKRAGDGGIDVYAMRGREGELIQCKSSGGSEVGWDAIKEVTAGSALYQVRFPGTLFRRIAVTNRSFTANAREHAAANRVRLVERREIDSMLAEHPVLNHELDAAIVDAEPMLHSEWSRVGG